MSKLKKLNKAKKDCTGLYVPGNQSDDAKVLKIILKVSPKVNGKQKLTQKVYTFRNVTMTQAIDQMQVKRQELIEAVLTGTHNKVIVIGFYERLIAYWDSRTDVGDDALYNYRTFAKKWIKSSACANTPYDEVTVEHLLSIQATIIDAGRNAYTAHTLKGVTNPMFKHERSLGRISNNPAELLKKPKIDNTVHIDLTEKEIKRVFACAREYKVEPARSVFEFLLAGRRINEVLSLKWTDVIDDEYVIRATNNKARREMRYRLNDRLIAAIDLQDHESEYVFHSRQSFGKMHVQGIHQHWQKVLTTAKVGHLRLHDIRHMIGTTLINNDVPLETIATVLGHVNIATTQRYSKRKTELASWGVDKLDELLG